MSAIVTCDSRNRVVVRDAVPGQKYRVKGLTLEPVVEAPAPRKPKEWAGGKKGLGEHLDSLAALGFEMPEPVAGEISPCRPRAAGEPLS